MVIDRNTIHSILAEAVPYGWQKQIAARLGVSSRHLRRMIAGKAPASSVVEALRRLGYTVVETVEVREPTPD
jgi:hypothetical protein